MTNECCCLCGKEYTTGYNLSEYGLKKYSCKNCSDQITKWYRTFEANYVHERIKQEDDKTKCYFCSSKPVIHICYYERGGVLRDIYLCKKCNSEYAESRKKFIKTMGDYLTSLYAFEQE